MKTIIFIVGHSASGKSTIIQHFSTSKDYTILCFSKEGKELANFIHDNRITNQIEKKIYSTILERSATNNRIVMVDGVSSYRVLDRLVHFGKHVKIIEVYSSYFVRINRIKKDLHCSTLKAISFERKKRKNKRISGLNKIIDMSNHQIINNGDASNAILEFERILNNYI